MMPLDSRLDPRFIGKAYLLLVAGGYQAVTQQMLSEVSVRAISIALGGASRRRQKTVLELIELAVDDSFAA